MRRCITAHFLQTGPRIQASESHIAGLTLEPRAFALCNTVLLLSAWVSHGRNSIQKTIADEGLENDREQLSPVNHTAGNDLQ